MSSAGGTSGADDFYVYLPSNLKSPTFDATNRISAYETKLETPISIDSRLYEIGVARLMITKSWYSLTETYFAYYSVALEQEMYSNLTEGFYETIEDVYAEFKEILGADAPHYVFEINKRSQTIVLTMNDPRCFLDLSTELEVMTGFKGRISGSGSFPAAHAFDVTVGMPVIYIYSDVCGHSLCAESSLPLLCVVEVQPNVPRNGAMVYNFPRVTYVPLERDYIDNIKIQLARPDGSPIKFSHGSVFVQLHIRRKKRLL